MAVSSGRAEHRRSRWSVRAVLVATILSGACASDAPPPVRAPTPFAGAKEIDSSRVHGGDNGLEVIRWSAPCDATQAAAVLTTAGAGGTLPTATLERLRRNGFVVAEVPTDRLPAALAELGGTLADVRNWHGQVPEWRDLVRIDVGPGRAIYTGGHVKPLRGGSLRLAMRAWTVPMEDGGLLWLELLPHAVERESATASALAPRDRVRGQPFAEAGLAVVLDPGWSLLMCPEPAASGESPSSSGPAAEPPSTLGAMLLPIESLPLVDDSARQDRTPVLVFIARLPDALVPIPSATPEATP